MDEAPRESGNYEFGSLDYSGEIDRSFRCLPHWFQPGVTIFVTFRTADSMPTTAIRRWQHELAEWLTTRGTGVSESDVKSLPPALQREYHRLRDRLWHRALDECHGTCVLRSPRIARVVSDALLHFNGLCYDLDSFVVMPNHVHVLVQFRDGHTLKKQSFSWLRYTARRINEQLNRTGAFWQPEPFDHLVRSAEQFAYLQRYLFENPEKSRLHNGEYIFWSYAGVQR